MIPAVMAKLSDLLRDLDRALAADDQDTAASVRRTIAEGHPGTPEAAEAHFKLGLFQLFKRQDLDAAATHLREAAKAKHAVWSPQARISLGLILHRQGKFQQAVFELRRVSGMTPPSLITAQAAGLVVLSLRSDGKAQEAERARGQQLDMLDKLTRSLAGEEQAMARFMLGMEHKHDGRRDKAKPLLQAALTGGLPAAEAAVAKRALADL